MRDNESREARQGDRQQDGGTERDRNPNTHAQRQKAEERYI